MKHFYSFLKRKGLFIETEGKTAENLAEVHMFNHELMEVGYIMTGKLFNALAVQSIETLTSLRNELMDNINKFLPKSGGTIIYRNFPNDIPLGNYQYIMNGMNMYFNTGSLTDIGTHIPNGFTFEPKKLKKIDLISKSQVDSILTDLLYSASSISKQDKEIVDYFINEGATFNFDKIVFNETKAYVGKRLMENESLTILPIKSATTLLRIFVAYNGGDEGLKENTKFKYPSKRLVRLLSTTLDKCYDLEESFKIYREVWLKVLFYLNPMSPKNVKLYPNLAKFALALRNDPKSLKTFNSKIEDGLSKKDKGVLELLKTRPGVFSRRLDHCVRVFGAGAVDKFLETNAKMSSLVDVYNHFTNRDTSSARSAILASGSGSNLVNYGAVEALPKKLVESIKTKLMGKLSTLKNEELADKKVYIDDKLYYRMLVSNNRGSNASLGSANGTVEFIEPTKNVIRLFVQWYSYDDIDLSGFAITTDKKVTKIGWNGSHNLTNSIIYSGDNTGRSLKNDEYIDIVINKLPSDIEWIICDARVYSGKTYAKFDGGSPIIGWLQLENGGFGQAIQNDLISTSALLSSDTKNVYTLAYNVKQKCVVYLDMSQGDGSVTNDEDVLNVVDYMKNRIHLTENGTNTIDWTRINQGHILNLVSTTVVDKPEDADILFDENTTFEEIAKYL